MDATIFLKRGSKMRILLIGVIWFCLLPYACKQSGDEPDTQLEEGLFIQLISPVRGIPGDTVTIQGKNFIGSVKVTFGSLLSKVLEVSDEKIIAIVPEGVVSNTTVAVSSGGKTSNSLSFHFQTMDKMELADPTIFLYKDTYYVYGTGGRGGDVNRGFLVYSSPDLRKWYGPKGAKQGYSLTKEDAFGDWGFWAPQLFLYQDEIYMAYTANENIAIAKSQSPLGPFVKHTLLIGPTRQIDPFVFFDDDGKIYIYYVRLSGGNKIYVAELDKDLTAIVPGTELLCIQATDVWEDTHQINWRVTEGPTLIKKEGKYYLFYSANHFENRDYAVGYAVSDSPRGPWIKSNQNPILSWGLVGIYGAGHGDFFQDKNNEYHYVFHTHFDNSRVQPRLTALIKGEFSALNPQGQQRVTFSKESFKYLLINN